MGLGNVKNGGVLKNVPCNSVLLSKIGNATTFMSVSELKAL